MRCGQCGGGVRGYRGTLHGRPIADWKHTDVPADWREGPHRPILGTPVDQATLDRIHRPPSDEVSAPEKPPTPQIVERWLVSADDASEYQSVSSMLKLAALEGWTVLRLEYRGRADGVEYLLMSARRRDLGALAIWRFNREKASWEFDTGWRRTVRGVSQVGSSALKTWLKTRDEQCPDCGASSAVHRPEECAA